MPSPQSVSPVTKVKPVAPNKPDPADTADPGQMEKIKQQQLQTKTGKYGKQDIKPHSYKKDEPGPDEPPKTHWIEVMLINEADEPVPGEVVHIKGPDGETRACATDMDGLVRVDCLDPGSCEISFPNLDKDAWEPK